MPDTVRPFNAIAFIPHNTGPEGRGTCLSHTASKRQSQVWNHCQSGPQIHGLGSTISVDFSEYTQC